MKSLIIKDVFKSLSVYKIRFLTLLNYGSLNARLMMHGETNENERQIQFEVFGKV